MNSLSWALYAAGTFDGVKIVLIFVAVFLGPLRLVATAIQRNDANTFRSIDPGRKPWEWPKASVAASIALVLVSCAVPSAKTVYLIAASEAGERVASSPEGREMLNLVRQRIRDLLSDKA